MPMNLYDDRARGFFSAPFTMARFDTLPGVHLPPPQRDLWMDIHLEDPEWPL